MEVKEPRVISRASMNHNRVTIHSARFCFAIKTLDRIAAEFGCDKSNDKSVTLLRGAKATADADIASRLVGKRFMVDMAGREIPIALGKFSQDTLDIVEEQVPDSMNEQFVQDLTGEARDATKFKLMLKAILMYGRVMYLNDRDQNIIMFEVISEPTGEGLVNAVFRAGSDDADLWCSITEASEFSMES